MRVLITGASGFAGGYLARACADAGDEVIGVSPQRRAPGRLRRGGASSTCAIETAVRALIRDVRPEVVYHLAALSSVGRSWEDPRGTVEDNVATAGQRARGLCVSRRRARAWSGSARARSTATPARLPIDEDARVQPANPYAVSKIAGDLLAGVYADAHGLDLIRARPFNHAGPGPAARPSSSPRSRDRPPRAGLAGASRIRIVTGNPETRRDFTDVRDVVRAYRLLADAGAGPGSTTSARAARSRPPSRSGCSAELVAPLEIEHVVDPARIRAHEVMDLRGSNDRIRDGDRLAAGDPVRGRRCATRSSGGRQSWRPLPLPLPLRRRRRRGRCRTRGRAPDDRARLSRTRARHPSSCGGR